jgi:hypothetical protein
VADRSSDDRMDEMFDAIRLELETNFDDPPTLEVQKFFDMLRALEESLHEHILILKQMLHGALTPDHRCPSYNNHKKPKHLYQSKNFVCSWYGVQED